MKRYVLLAVLLLLPAATGRPDSGPTEGDQKISDTIKKIQEAEEDPAGQPEPGKKDEEGEGNLLLELLARIFAEIFWEYAFSVRFADYPYAETADFFYSTSVFVSPAETKALSVCGVADLSYHADGTYGNANRVAAHLGAFHLNLYNQNVFSRHRAMSVFSANAGFSLIVRGFSLSGYLGAYKLSFLDTWQLSFGLSSQVFLPAHLYLDIYNLNAVLGGTTVAHFAASLNWTARRLTVGVGYNRSDLGGFVYTGPCLRLGLWL